MDELYLLRMAFKHPPDLQRYPFSLPAVKNLEKLQFDKPITFLMGENGTGKSTLLEAIAVNFGFNPEGGTRNFCFSSRDTHSCLWREITLVKGYRRPRDGFFLRAESFYNAASYIDELDEQPAPSPRVIASYGGVSLHKMSHGESFFALATQRFSGQGLYLLDEPEAALSPFKQMALLSRICELARQESQFVIATHSPILSACPNSRIYLLEESGVRPVEYRETPHYQLTKAFLDAPERMLRELTGRSGSREADR